jgi:hypothetical protein
MFQNQERLTYNKVGVFCELLFIVLKRTKKRTKNKKGKINKSNETLVK